MQRFLAAFWDLSPRGKREVLGWGGLLALLVVALALRVHFFSADHCGNYNHDIYAHTVFVQYVREHRHLPPIGDGFEFAQQPLYYVFAAPFYDPRLSPENNWPDLALLGLVVSTGALCLSFRALFYLSSWYVRYGVFIFLAFTPAFIIAAPFIGNDGLLRFFCAWFFLCALRFNRAPTRRHLALLLAALAGALFSKFNAVALLAFVPWMLWRASRADASWRPSLGRASVLAVVVGAWAGVSAARAWNPADHSFTYYQGWVWDYMQIKEKPLTYLLRFDLSDLIRNGQATTTSDSTPDSVRFSFPAWEYGNMLLGEYDYSDPWEPHHAAQAILVLGTYNLLGLLLFPFLAVAGRPRRGFAALFSFNRTILLALLTGLALLLAFIARVPNTCTADFRYLWPLAPWLALAVWRGLTCFPRGQAPAALGVMLLAAYVPASVWLFAAFN